MPNPRSETSRVYQAVLAVLADGDWHSSWEITRGANLCDTTPIREMRTHGWEIEGERRTGGVYWYRLTEKDLERLIEVESKAQVARLEAMRAQLAARREDPQTVPRG